MRAMSCIRVRVLRGLHARHSTSATAALATLTSSHASRVTSPAWLHVRLLSTGASSIDTSSASYPYLPPSVSRVGAGDADLAAEVLKHAQSLEENEELIQDLCHKLEEALRFRDFRAISDLWPRLKDLQAHMPSALNVRLHWRNYADIIDTYPDEIDPSFLPILDDLSAHAAMTGYFRGVSSRLEYHLDRGDYESALAVGLRTMELVRSRQVRLNALKLLCVSRQIAEIVNASGGHSGPPPPRFLAGAISACFMKGTFHSLLCFGVVEGYHAPLYVIRDNVVEASRRYGLPEKLVMTWAQRYCALAAAARGLGSFKAYIHDQSTDLNPLNFLTHLTEGILDELSNRIDPCLTLDPAVAAKSEHPLILFTSEHLAILMRGLIRAEKVSLAERLWMATTATGLTTPPLVQAAIIDGFASRKDFHRARAAWKAFVAGSDTPEPVVYRAYIKALFREGDREGAMAEFERFDRSLWDGRSRVASPDLAAFLDVYNSVLEWLVANSSIDEARRILERMKKNGPAPNATSFNIFMKHHGRNKNLREVSAIMQEMADLNMHGDISTAAVLLPSLYLARSDAPALVMKLLNQYGIPTTKATYESLLSHLVLSDEDAAFDAAIALLDFMEANGPETAPTVGSLCKILQNIERRVWDNPSLAARHRRTVLRRLRRLNRNFEILGAVMGRIIKACCRNPTPEGLRQAMEYYQAQRNARAGEVSYKVGPRVWVQVMRAAVRRGEWEIADELAKDAQSDIQHLPLYATYLMEQASLRNSDILVVDDDDDDDV